MAGAGDDMASSASLPPRGNLLPEPSNPFHAHAAASNAAAKTRATEAAAAERLSAAAAPAEKAEKTARDRAAAGLPPLRRRSSRKAASTRAVNTTAGQVAGGSTALAPAATPTMMAPKTAVAIPLAASPTAGAVLALALVPVAATEAPPPIPMPYATCILSPTPTIALGASSAPATVATFPRPASATTSTPLQVSAAGATAAITPCLAPITSSIVSLSPTLNLAGALAPTLWAAADLPRAAPTTQPAVTPALLSPSALCPVLEAAAAARPSHTRPSTPLTRSLSLAAAIMMPAGTPMRGDTSPLMAGPSGPRVDVTSARPPLQAAAAPTAAAVGAGAAAAAASRDARALSGSGTSVSCMCSDGRGIKHLLMRIDELEAAGKKRRAATNMRLQDLRKRQTAASAHAGDAKRILSEVPKAVNYVGTASGHGASNTNVLCRAVRNQGVGTTSSAGPARADPATGVLLSPAAFDTPRKAPSAKD